jgi:hypothetical protein
MFREVEPYNQFTDQVVSYLVRLAPTLQTP